MQRRPLSPHGRAVSVAPVVTPRRRRPRRHAGVEFTLTPWVAGCAPAPWPSTDTFDTLLQPCVAVGAGLVAPAGERS